MPAAGTAITLFVLDLEILDVSNTGTKLNLRPDLGKVLERRMLEFRSGQHWMVVVSYSLAVASLLSNRETRHKLFSVCR